MSIHTDDLRDLAANRGLSVCDAVADELEDHEKAYALLFAENATLRTEIERLRASVDALRVTFRANMLRYGPPNTTHAEISRVLDAAVDAARASVKGST